MNSQDKFLLGNMNNLQSINNNFRDSSYQHKIINLNFTNDMKNNCYSSKVSSKNINKYLSSRTIDCYDHRLKVSQKFALNCSRPLMSNNNLIFPSLYSNYLPGTNELAHQFYYPISIDTNQPMKWLNEYENVDSNSFSYQDNNCIENQRNKMFYTHRKYYHRRIGNLNRNDLVDTRYVNLESEIRQLQVKFDWCTNEMNDLKKENANLMRIQSNFLEQNENLQFEYEKCLSKINYLTYKLNENNNQDLNKKKIKKMRLELKQSKNKYRNLQHGIDNIKSQLQISENKLNKSDAQNKILQNDVEYKQKFYQLNEANKDLQQKYSQLQAQNENSKSEINKYLSLMHGLYEKLQEKDKQNKILQNDYDVCKMKLNQSDDANKILQQKNSQSVEKSEYLNFKKFKNSKNSDEINENIQNKNVEQINNQNDTNENSEINIDEVDKMVRNPHSSNSQISDRFSFTENNLCKNESSQADSVKPMGFKNPKGLCFLNSVIQVLASCEDFKTDIKKSNWKPTDNTDDSIFVKGFFELIEALQNSDSHSLNEALNIVQKLITESSLGDDVYKCFMNLLSRISKVVKTNIERSNEMTKFITDNKAQTNFERYKNRNPGFVFDNFYGQFSFHMTCNICNEILNESFQVMKSLPLPVIKSNSPVTLESCINLFFSHSKVEGDKFLKCKCKKESTNMTSRIKLTHGPKYLFIYLNRGSYTEDGEKNQTCVTCDENAINIIDSTDKSIQYKLISVIDHVGNTFGGHYYCKSSFESNQWWLLNDSEVTQHLEAVVTKDTIVLLFKRSY